MSVPKKTEWLRVVQMDFPLEIRLNGEKLSVLEMALYPRPHNRGKAQIEIFLPLLNYPSQWKNWMDWQPVMKEVPIPKGELHSYMSSVTSLTGETVIRETYTVEDLDKRATIELTLMGHTLLFYNCEKPSIEGVGDRIRLTTVGQRDL